MRLFSSQGFSGTSVAQIERAAGLTPGAGGLYHHFRSKDDVLAGGVSRHLARLGALRDIRRLFTGVADLRTELTVTARYVLAELASESVLLQVLATEARARPELVDAAVTALVETTYAEFAVWLEESWAVPPERARALTAVALGALVAHRLLGGLFPGRLGIDDDAFVTTWTETFTLALTAGAG
jgi:AcrR family transcriptional regulator